MRWTSRLLIAMLVGVALLHCDVLTLDAAPRRCVSARDHGMSPVRWRCRRCHRFRCPQPVAACPPNTPEAAVAYWNCVVAREPCNGQSYFKRAEAWVELGELQRAIDDLGTAIRLDPASAQNYAARAELLMTVENRRDEALADFSKALEIEPGNTQYRLLRSIALAARHRESDAAAEMDTILKAQPGNSVAALMKAVFALAAGGSPEDITAQAEKNLDAKDRGAISLLSSAASVQRKRPDEAIAELTRYIASHQDSREGYALRAEAYIGAKQYALALADLDACIRVAPDHYAAYARKAWLLATCPDAKLRNGQLAVELATRACQLQKWKRPARQALAAAYAEAGEFDKAIEQETLAMAEIKAAPDSTRLPANVVWHWPPLPPPGLDRESKLKNAAAQLESYREHKAWRE